MKTNIEWIDGVNFTANTESGNKIMMDGPVISVEEKIMAQGQQNY